MKMDKIECLCGHTFNPEWPIESLIPETICSKCNKIHTCTAARKRDSLQIYKRKKNTVKSICVVS